jgi:hypothetical protein
MKLEIEVNGTQEEKLQSLARERGVSVEDAVRICLDEREGGLYITPAQADRKTFYERAWRWVGAFEDIEGATDLSVNHDRYLTDPDP